MNKKSFISGMLMAVILIGIIGTAHAQNTATTVDIYYRDIIIKINGQEVKTNETEPFILNGSTYLPIRAVSEALGLEVTWDDETSTVGLNNPNRQTDKINYWIWSIAENIEITCKLANRPMILHGTTGETYEETKKMEESKSFYQEEKNRIENIFYKELTSSLSVSLENWNPVINLFDKWQKIINLVEEEIHQFGTYTTAKSNEKDQIFISMRDTYQEIIDIQTEVEEQVRETLKNIKY